MVDSKNLDDLFPAVKRAAIELIKRMKERGYNIGISSTFRDAECQNEIYTQGRTKPCRIVTNAKGGQSIHNYHLAFDIIQNVLGKEYDIDVIQLAGKIGMDMGLEWGGSWKNFIDMPHFQWTGGLSLEDLQSGKTPEDVPLLWELQNPDTPSKPIEIDILIDGKLFKTNSIIYQDKNHIDLLSLTQAGYYVTYLEDKKILSVSK